MGLLDQHGVDDAVLAGAAHNPGAPCFGRDDCTLREKVPADIVDVCRVCFHIQDGRFLGLAGCGVGDRGNIQTECPNLCVAAAYPDNPVPVLPDMRFCGGPAVLIPPLAARQVVPAAGEAPNGSTLPLYSITSGLQSLRKESHRECYIYSGSRYLTLITPGSRQEPR